MPTAAWRREAWTSLSDGRWIERIVSTNSGSTYCPAGTNRYVWDGNVLLAVLDHTNGLVMSFVRGLDLSGTIQGAGGVGGVLAVTFRTNGTQFVAYDGNGNVAALTDASTGANSAVFEYGPFGEPLRVTGPAAAAMPLRFSTMYEDDVTGDRKYRFREYRPSLGRWLSRDPFGEAGFETITVSSTKALAGRSMDHGRNSKTGSEIRRQNQLLAAKQQQNPYGFVNNEPIHRIDLLGLFTDSGVKICYEAGWGLGQHRWIEYPGGSAGFYPGESGIWPGGPGAIESPDPHTGDSDKHCDPIGLLPCCDKDKFLKCVTDRVAQDADSPPWYNVPNRTCQWWADVVVKDCLKKCRK